MIGTVIIAVAAFATGLAIEHWRPQPDEPSPLESILSNPSLFITSLAAVVAIGLSLFTLWRFLKLEKKIVALENNDKVTQAHLINNDNDIITSALQVEEEIEKLKNDYKIEKAYLQEKINDIEDQIKNCKSSEKIKLLEKEKNTLEASLENNKNNYDKEIARLQKKQDEINTVLASKELNTFYKTVQTKLGEVFLAYRTIDSGLIEGNVGNKTKNFIDKIKLAGEFIPLPFALPISRWASTLVQVGLWAVNKKEKKDADRRVEKIAQLAHSFKEVDHLTENAARKLALMYGDQIKELEQASVQCLAEVAVKLMVASLWAGRIEEEEEQQVELELIDELITIVANVEASKEEVKKGWFEKLKRFCKVSHDKFLFDLPLERKNGDGSWTTLGVFYRSGIKVETSSNSTGDSINWSLYNTTGMEPKKYGYRIGDKKETANLSPVGTQSSLKKCPENFNLSQGLVSKKLSIFLYQEVQKHTDDIKMLTERLEKNPKVGAGFPIFTIYEPEKAQKSTQTDFQGNQKHHKSKIKN